MDQAGLNTLQGKFFTLAAFYSEEFSETPTPTGLGESSGVNKSARERTSEVQLESECTKNRTSPFRE